MNSLHNSQEQQCENRVLNYTLDEGGETVRLQLYGIIGNNFFKWKIKFSSIRKYKQIAAQAL